MLMRTVFRHPSLCAWQSTAALTKNDFEFSCLSLPPDLRLLHVCIQSVGGEVLKVLRRWRNLSLGDASQPFSLKRCPDILRTFQSILVLKRVLVFSGMVRAGSLTARCVPERWVYHTYEVGLR